VIGAANRVNGTALTALYSVRRVVSTGLRRAPADRRRRTAPISCRGPVGNQGGRVEELEEQQLDRTANLEEFLRGVERQAYVMARTLTGDAEEAMDVVQDTMLRFSRRYTGRPAGEWRPIFFRILVNRGRDFQRRRAVRSRVMSWFRNEDLPDPIDVSPAPRGWDPAVAVADSEAMTALEQAVAGLPPRQREAFVLRCLEGQDVAATAGIMGCSEGSVKTHYSRALGALRHRLGEHYDG